MFCTSLRRRASFSAAIPLLQAESSLGLRETALDTHDIAIPLQRAADTRSDDLQLSHQLRVLLFSPSATEIARIGHTVQRIRHFASLTGGQNLALVFLLHPPAATTFVSAKQLVEEAEQSTPGNSDGIIAYAKLEATLADEPDIPYIPLLLIPKVDGLPTLLRTHHARICQARMPTVPGIPVSPFDLLLLCTANPPMSQQTALFLTDLFRDLKELAAACTAVTSPLGSSPPSAQVDASSTLSSHAEKFEGNESGQGKLKRLRELVGERQCADVIDFWKAEWTVD